MNKTEIVKGYQKEEDRLLIAKALDKLEIAKSKNKITYTDFLDGYQKKVIETLVKKLQIKNILFYGGIEEAQRNMAIFYPDKLEIEMVEKNYDQILDCIEILLPNELQGTYQHRDYLGGLMKLGIRREKIGDIIPFSEGADIIVVKEIAQYIKTSLEQLTRFSKSHIQIKPIQQIHPLEIQKEEIQIMVSSLRADNIVSELGKTSRKKAEEWIQQGRVFANYEPVVKDCKLLKENDKITIRGKGRFELKEVIGNTKKGRYIIKVEKYQ